MKKFLEIGSLGWQHAAWHDSFYPEELPEEWQLTYYANEFRFVLVPVQAWSEADDETLAQWRDDVHERFRFMFELTPQAIDRSAENLGKLMALYSGVLIGFVFRPAGNGIESYLATLKELNKKAKVYVDYGPGNIPGDRERKLLSESGLAFCVHAGDQGSEQGAELCFIASSEEIRDKRKLSAILQSFLANTGREGEFFLVFTGNPPPAQVMRDAVVISDLLGA